MDQKRKIDNHIPGYSGYIPRKDIPNDKIPRVDKGNGHIPGYCGFVPSIIAENHFSKSYGTTTYEVHQAELKTESILQSKQINHSDLENDSDLKSSVLKKLTETNTIQNDNIKYRNVFLYNIEKIKNAHLENKPDHNKVNDLFSMTGSLKKTIDPKTLTNHLQKMLCESKLGNLING